MVIVVERREPKINMAEKLVVKTVWEKGSTTETPMRHKNGLKTSLSIFFLKMPKICVGRTTLNGEKKGGWPLGCARIFFAP